MNERSLGIATFSWFRVDTNPKFISEMVNMEQLRQIKDIPTQIKNPELVERRRRQIAEAAVQLFIKKGFHKTTTREIAQAVGFSIGGKGYIGTGAIWSPTWIYYKDFWEYDPVANTWTQKEDVGGTARRSPTS